QEKLLHLRLLASLKGSRRFPCGIVPRDARDAAAGMRPGTAEIESFERHAVVPVSERGPGAEKLVQRELPVEDIAADEAELALEVERGKDPPAEDRGAEVRREPGHMVDHGIGGALALRVPASPTGQRIPEVLAEEARDVLAGRRERVVDRAGNEHLHDRL